MDTFCCQQVGPGDRGSRLRLYTKYVISLRYMASGPEEWICKRVGEVRAIFEAHFKGRLEDLSLRT